MLFVEALENPRLLASVFQHASAVSLRGTGPRGSRGRRSISGNTQRWRWWTHQAVDVDGGLRATADEEKKYRP